MLPIPDCRLNAFPVKIPLSFLTEIEKAISSFMHSAKYYEEPKQS